MYIADLRERDQLQDEAFLVQDVVRRQTKSGNPFVLYTLSDRSGQMNGVFWDVPEEVAGWLRPGLAVLVSGEVTRYKQGLQIRATGMRPWPDADPVHFLPASKRPREEMVAELRGVIGRLGEPWERLVGHILLQEEFLERYATAPAARNMHHAYVGGLLEHTLSMAALAEMVTTHYPYVNKGLLLAGVLLHDVGKTEEYVLEAGFAYSQDGRLVGHIVRAVIMVEQAAAKLGDVPAEDVQQLVHLIASHHGKHEWGSPVAPKTIEAVLLHQIDLLDSRVQGFFEHLRNDGGETDWSTRPSAMFGTELHRPAGFDDAPDD